MAGTTGNAVSSNGSGGRLVVRSHVPLRPENTPAILGAVQRAAGLRALPPGVEPQDCSTTFFSSESVKTVLKDTTVAAVVVVFDHRADLREKAPLWGSRLQETFPDAVWTVLEPADSANKTEPRLVIFKRSPGDTIATPTGNGKK